MRLLALILALAALAAGCDGAMDPRGPRAQPIADIWWVMLILATAVSVLVLVLTLMALLAGRRRGRELGEPGRGLWGMILGGGIVLPLVVVVFLAIWSLGIDRDLFASSEDELTVEVIGHQFWWEVRYPGTDVVTANEIVIPTGQPVRVLLRSEDVIHSLWIPQLGGKGDTIPGRTNQMYLEADEPGWYRGQCAEFCGIQHAQMRVFVDAREPEAFTQWLEEQQAPAPEPFDDEVFDEGREIFGAVGCASCHAVRGHEYTGRVGPDLTHLGSRETLAAGTIENTPGALGGWILQPQQVKPGAQMPATSLAPGELQALLHYLGQLE